MSYYLFAVWLGGVFCTKAAEIVSLFYAAAKSCHQIYKNHQELGDVQFDKDFDDKAYLNAREVVPTSVYLTQYAQDRTFGKKYDGDKYNEASDDDYDYHSDTANADSDYDSDFEPDYAGAGLR